MKLTFLGTGSAMPTGKRFQTGLLLEADGDTLLIDCGSGALHGLAATPVGYEGIDTVLLTHHHLDHISDLPVLLKARWLAGETEITLAGPPGTEQLVTDIVAVHDYMQGRNDITYREVDSGEAFELAGFSISALEVHHSMYCLAYRFEHPNSPGTFVFSGDTEASAELIDFADGADVLAHDCSFPDELDVSNHPTPQTLGRVLGESSSTIDHVYLTHLYPHTEGKHDEMLESLGSHYDGEVSFARDDLTVEIE